MIAFCQSVFIKDYDDDDEVNSIKPAFMTSFYKIVSS